MAAIAVLQADVGKTICWSLLVAVPVAIVMAWLYGRTNVVSTGVPLENAATAGQTTRRPAGFALSLFTLLLPVACMVLRTAAELGLNPDNALRGALMFVGQPAVAMLLAVLFSFWSLGLHLGISRKQIAVFSDDCLAPVAGILLVVAAGGGFKEVLLASKVDEAIRNLADYLAFAAHVGLVDRGGAARGDRFGHGGSDRGGRSAGAGGRVKPPRQS